MSILTNQDSASWTNQTVKIWSLHLHEDGPIRNQGRDLSVSQLPSGSGSTLPLSTELNPGAVSLQQGRAAQLDGGLAAGLPHSRAVLTALLRRN